MRHVRALFAAALAIPLCGFDMVTPNYQDDSPPIVELKFFLNGQYQTVGEFGVYPHPGEVVKFLCVVSDPGGILNARLKIIADQYTNSCEFKVNKKIDYYDYLLPITNLPPANSITIKPNKDKKVVNEVPLLLTLDPRKLQCKIPGGWVGYLQAATVSVSCKADNWSTQVGKTTTEVIRAVHLPSP